MNAFSRWFIYAGCLAGSFAVGSWLIPSANGPLGQSKRQTEAARQQAWAAHLEKAAAEPDLARRQAAVLTLLDRMEKGDFAAALPSVRAHRSAFPIFASLWEKVDREGLFSHLAKNGGVKSPENQELASHLLMGSALVSVNEAEAAASRLRQPGSSYDTFKPIALALLRTDVRKGVAFLAAHQETLSDDEIVRELRAADLTAGQWPEKTIDARIAWLSGLPASGWRDKAMESLYANWAAENPEAVLTAAQQRGATSAQVTAAARIWLEKSPEAVLDFFKTKARDEVKAALAIAWAERLASTDLQSAWDFARWEVSGETRVLATQKVLQAAMAREPQTAAGWLHSSAESPWRPQALKSLANHWQKADPAAYQAWLQTLSPADLAVVQVQPQGTTNTVGSTPVSTTPN